MTIIYVLVTFLVFMRGCFVCSALQTARARAKRVGGLQVQHLVRADISVLRMMLDFRKWEDDDFFPKRRCINCDSEDMHDFYRGPDVIGRVCGKCECVEKDL